MAKRYRNKTIKVMVTEEGKAAVKEKMSSVGMVNTSEFLRMLLKYGAVYNFDTNNMAKLAYEINRVSNNINQIAKKVNQADSVNKNDLDEILKKLNYLNEYLDKLYSLKEKIQGEK